MRRRISQAEAFDLWITMSQVRNAILKVRLRELNKLKLSFAQAGAINAIRSMGGNVTPTQIAQYMVRSPHSVSVLLRRMEVQGLITKKQDANRKNMLRVNLTEKGDDTSKKQLEESEKIQSLMAALSVKERRQFKSHLLKIGDRAAVEIGFTIPHKYRHEYYHRGMNP